MFESPERVFVFTPGGNINSGTPHVPLGMVPGWCVQFIPEGFESFDFESLLIQKSRNKYRYHQFFFRFRYSHKRLACMLVVWCVILQL